MTMPVSGFTPPEVGAIEQFAQTLAQAATSSAGPASFASALDAALAAIAPVQEVAPVGTSSTTVSAPPPAVLGSSTDPFGGLVPVGTLPLTQPGAVGDPQARAVALAAASREVGVPYVWGGASPASGFDCSGLVQWAYSQAGVTLPRTAAEQEQVGVEVPSLAQAQPGDLVFYGNPAYHVAIYAGNGMVIQAPATGSSVELAPVGTPTEIRDPTATVPLATASSNGSQVQAYASTFEAASAAYGLPPGMLQAVAQVESDFNPLAVSSAGAEGIMQLMPQTAASLGVDPYNPTQAIWGAAKLLAQKLATFGSVPLALAAYNAGDGAVEAYGGIPPYPQTQAYVAKVTALMEGGASGTGASA